MKIYRCLLVLTTLIIFRNGFNAQTLFDSLQTVLKNAVHDTTRVKTLSSLSEQCEIEDILKYAEPCIKIAEKNLNTTNKILKSYYQKYLAMALNNTGYYYQQQRNVQKALDFYEKSLKNYREILERSENPTEKTELKKGISQSLNNIGLVYSAENNLPKALEYFQKSLTINKEIQDKKAIAQSLNDLGSVYNYQGDISNALEYFHAGLKIYEEINEQFGMANTLNNIGIIYKRQGDYSKGIECYEKALKIEEEIGSKGGIAHSLNNIGIIYDKQGNTLKALEFYNRSLNIREEIQDKSGIANSLICIGDIYDKQNANTKALGYYLKSLKIQEEIGDKEGMAYSLNNIGISLFKQGKIREANVYAERSMKSAREIGYPENIKFAASLLKNIYKKQNRHKKAFDMYELEMQMRDSINNQDTKKASVKKQFQYQYEKKAAADSVKNAEEQKVKNAVLTAQQAQLRQERTKSYALYGGLALVLVFAGFMVNRFRITNKQKQIIELKEIETQKQNEIITIQKHLVEEKHKEITDSINYAERIQRSFLATTELLDNNLSSLRGTKQSQTKVEIAALPLVARNDDRDYFVLFQPKDVVSGDFYWAASTGSANNKKFILCTADSTGHGVPGAIMSILNISCLEKALQQEKLMEPADILNHTRTKIIERLKKDGSPDGGKDGMDCSLICFDFDNSSLTYAAANNPVWIVRKAEAEALEVTAALIELPADKMPVGKHDRDHIPFTQHTVSLQKGDIVYALTDGLPDQFGGPKGKKFMYKQLKELLVRISHLSMAEQKERLTSSLNTWKGDLEQVDDVCVIGMRI